MELTHTEDNIKVDTKGDKILNINLKFKISEDSEKEKIMNYIQGYVIAYRNSRIMNAKRVAENICPLTSYKKPIHLTEREAIRMKLITRKDANACRNSESYPSNADNWIDFNENYIALKVKGKRKQYTIRLKNDDE